MTDNQFSIEQAAADGWDGQITPVGAKDWYSARFTATVTERLGGVSYQVFANGEAFQVDADEIRNLPSPPAADEHVVAIDVK
jgi:hypothetical protein